MRTLRWRARKSETAWVMSAQIIANDVDRLLLGQAGQQLFQKGHELRAGVTGRGAANDFAAGGMQCGVEGKRTVPVVLKTVALGPARAQGQDRIQAVQCLDSALFIHTEHCGMERRFLIKTDDIEGFFFKFRVVACHVARSRWGWIPARAQTRATRLCETPRCRASLRVVQ
jgi:hypothetical protein